MQPVPPKDMWMLLLSTIRYALGRQSYFTEDAVALVTKYRGYLTRWQLEQIAHEIKEEVALAERRGKTLGQPMDHTMWKEAAKTLLESATQ